MWVNNSERSIYLTGYMDEISSVTKQAKLSLVSMENMGATFCFNFISDYSRRIFSMSIRTTSGFRRKTVVSS